MRVLGRMFLRRGRRPVRNLDIVYFDRTLNHPVAFNYRSCRTLDRELLTNGEFYEFSAMRPKMHKITAFEDGTVHFAATAIVEILDHALSLLDVLGLRIFP